MTNCHEINSYYVCKIDGSYFIGKNESSGDAVADISKLSPDLNLISEYNGHKITDIGKNAFYNTTKLKTVTIGKFVINIHYGAFRHCINLRSVIVPPSVQFLGEAALRIADTEGVNIDCNYTVLFEPDSQLTYISYVAISGATHLNVIYCSCSPPTHFEYYSYSNVDFNFMIPIFYKVPNITTKVDSSQCNVYPVYNYFKCNCQSLDKNNYQLKISLKYLIVLIIK